MWYVSLPECSWKTQAFPFRSWHESKAVYLHKTPQLKTTQKEVQNPFGTIEGLLLKISTKTRPQRPPNRWNLFLSSFPKPPFTAYTPEN